MVGKMVGKKTGIHRLSARQITALGDGMHADGGGLYLQVTGQARSWIFRYQIAGQRRNMGLGSILGVSLAEARIRAAECRNQIANGIDPIKRHNKPSVMTWGECTSLLVESMAPGWKNKKHASQWINTVRDYGPDPAMPITAVDTAIALACLRPIWKDKTETASRVRGRCERVWDYAKALNGLSGENPFRWQGNLQLLLPKPSSVRKVKHHGSMPYSQLPEFMHRLRDVKAVSARAMEFTILTAARTQEVTGASMAEFDLPSAIWTIPPERMKAGKEHKVPLTPRAVEIITSLSGSKKPFHMSENTMLGILKSTLNEPYTVHGFRSSFSDWAHETTSHPNHVIEMALAHTIKNKAEAAYRRGDLMDKRRDLMADWASYLSARMPIEPGE